MHYFTYINQTHVVHKYPKYYDVDDVTLDSNDNAPDSLHVVWRMVYPTVIHRQTNTGALSIIRLQVLLTKQFQFE